MVIETWFAVLEVVKKRFSLLLFIVLISIHPFAAAQNIALRRAGQDGVNTYRIPALARSTNGTLIAVWDNRYDMSRDLQGNIDIGMCRSTDGGQTWSSMQTVLDMGLWGGLPQKFNGVSDAQLLVDTVSGRIWIAALWMHGVNDGKGKFIEGLTQDSTQWRHQWQGVGSQKGLTPRQTCQFVMVSSDDNGATWSDPQSITPATKPTAWWLYAPAPGNGITMRDGTLVMPTQGRDDTGRPFSNITYSTDRGASWITTAPPKFGTSECAVAELADGSLMLNIRDNDNRGKLGDGNGRSIFVTRDLGRTWIEHPTSRSALKEPVCMASLVKHGEMLLFCNPAATDGRYNITLKYSKDNGNTWSPGLVLDSGESFGYSSITSIDSETIGVLWEGSDAQMTFRAIKNTELR
ncbi:MAG: sialidase family protein [Mucinivorans sp.]